jgi:hypothetical protein
MMIQSQKELPLSDTDFDLLAFYNQPGGMTDPKEYATSFSLLPKELPALCQTIQNLLVHIFWAERYGLHLSEDRKAEVSIRPVHQKLSRLLEIDPAPLNTPRPLEKRLVSNCRDFSTFLCSILRSHKIPARARCGFGIYFLPNHFEDHWICEYWSVEQTRWVTVDAQLDSIQRQVLGISFDPLDLPSGQFVPGGEAWLLCRSGQADPDQFGIFEYHGWDFIRGNVIRDLLSLNKVEILPWDFVEALKKPYDSLSQEELTWLDRISEWTLSVDRSFQEIRAIYEETPSLHIPVEWFG